MTDERILTWERMFDAAETTDEQKQLWELAKTSNEMDVARAGFARATYPKEARD